MEVTEGLFSFASSGMCRKHCYDDLATFCFVIGSISHDVLLNLIFSRGLQHEDLGQYLSFKGLSIFV